MAGLVGGQFQPTGGKNPEAVAVGKDHTGTAGLTNSGDDAVESGGHLLGGFAAGAGLGEDCPARRLFANLRRGEALVIAIEPFGEIV